MNDTVLREVTCLIRDCRKMSETLVALRKALYRDKRFASLMATEESSSGVQEEMNLEKEGPAGQPDPFSVPLEHSHD